MEVECQCPEWAILPKLVWRDYFGLGIVGVLWLILRLVGQGMNAAIVAAGELGEEDYQITKRDLEPSL